MTADVPSAEARLERLIAGGAGDRAINRAQAQLERARERASVAERRARERAAIARDVARRTARAEEARRRQAAADAERSLRSSATAPTLTLAYAGLTVTAAPEAARDAVHRRTAVEAFRRAMELCATNFAAAVGAARASARGGASRQRPMSEEKLAAELRDVMRHGLAHETVTISVGGEPR
jgi:hypothetical protein